jgi:hypothetical protein
MMLKFHRDGRDPVFVHVARSKSFMFRDLGLDKHPVYFVSLLDESPPNAVEVMRENPSLSLGMHDSKTSLSAVLSSLPDLSDSPVVVFKEDEDNAVLDVSSDSLKASALSAIWKVTSGSKIRVAASPPLKVSVDGLSLGDVESVATVRDVLLRFRLFLNPSIGKKPLGELDPSTAAMSLCEIGGELRLESSQVFVEFNSSRPIVSYFNPRHGFPASGGTVTAGLFDKVLDVILNAKSEGMFSNLVDSSQVRVFLFNGFLFADVDLDASIGAIILKYPEVMSSDRLSLHVFCVGHPIQVHLDGELVDGCDTDKLMGTKVSSDSSMSPSNAGLVWSALPVDLVAAVLQSQELHFKKLSARERSFSKSTAQVLFRDDLLSCGVRTKVAEIIGAGSTGRWVACAQPPAAMDVVAINNIDVSINTLRILCDASQLEIRLAPQGGSWSEIC